jgi:4-amino-4-deoxy-L-arabinose transferase-like glycosyltransferase
MNRNRAIVAVFVGALVVRILFNVYLVGMDKPGFVFFPDGEEYDAIARSLAAGTGFEVNHSPNTFRPPGYPFFLAAIYAIGGPGYAVVKIVQSVVGALTCLMIVLIGEQLFSRRVGMMAGVIAAVYPFLVAYTGFLLSETLFVFLSTVFLYALVRLREDPAWLWVAVAGLVLGVMNLTRPVTLFLPVLLFFWLWVEWGAKRRAAVIAGMLALWMMVPIMPWTVRNYMVTNSFIPISSHLWSGLYAGNNPTIMHDPEAIGGSIEPEQLEDYRAAYLSFLQHYLVHEPMELLRLELHKLKRFWSVFPKTTSRDRVISVFSYGLLLPFFLIGMMFALQRHQKPWLLFFWILNFCLVTLIAHGSTRFRLPVEPVLILFGSLALERLWVRCTGGQVGLSAQRAG